MDFGYLIDKINIKELPEEITLFLGQNNQKYCCNLRGFYSRLLEEVGEDVKESYLNRILKYLSSDSPSRINIIDDFNENIYDENLKKFVKKLVNKINSCHNYMFLYDKLVGQVNYVFFSKEQYDCLIKFYHEKEYETFMFYLLRHAFSAYRYNIPGIVSKRIYHEALTLYFNSKHRSLMMKASADLGNEDAAILYADQIYVDDIDAAMIYFLKAKNNVSALWEIAFALENNNLKEETISIIEKELKDRFLENEFTVKLSVTTKGSLKRNSKTLMMAVKLNFYIIDKFYFSKALNSVGKLLIFDYIIYENNRDESIRLAKKILQKATKLGNINAMTNLAVYYEKNIDDSDYDFQTLKKMFKTSAEVGDIEACSHYGSILFKESKESDALYYLNYAADRKDGLACIKLADYYELKNQFEKASEYYKKAIDCKCYDGAYYLALLLIQKKYLGKNENINSNIIAEEYIVRYIDKFTESVKIKAQKILESIQ